LNDKRLQAVLKKGIEESFDEKHGKDEDFIGSPPKFTIEPVNCIGIT
jgi:hypothetical protein